MGASNRENKIKPEKKQIAEAKNVKELKETIWQSESDVPGDYPYVLPDYKLKFKHIGTEKQLFLDNYILDYLVGVERKLEKPTKHNTPILESSELPWEGELHYSTVIFEEETGRFRMWYSASLTDD